MVDTFDEIQYSALSIVIFVAVFDEDDNLRI